MSGSYRVEEIPRQELDSDAHSEQNTPITFDQYTHNGDEQHPSQESRPSEAWTSHDDEEEMESFVQMRQIQV